VQICNYKFGACFALSIINSYTTGKILNVQQQSYEYMKFFMVNHPKNDIDF